MVNGIIIEKNGLKEVKTVSRGQEQELLEKIEKLQEEYDTGSEFGLHEFTKDYNGKDWECDTGEGMLDLESSFGSDIHTLLDYIHPHLLVDIRRDDYGYVTKYGVRKPNSQQFQATITSYNTRREWDGFGNCDQMMFTIKFYEFGDEVGSISVLCGCNQYGNNYNDDREVKDWFDPLEVLTIMIRTFNLRNMVAHYY